MSEIGFHEFFQICGAALKNIDQAAVKGKKFHVSIDSRRIKEGEVFWALTGERFDGHNFIETVLKKKVNFCVVQEKRLKKIDFPAVIIPGSISGLQELGRIHRQLFDIPVLALTGSNGKTTTKEMIAQILGTKLNVHKTEGNLNNHIGCPLTLLELTEHHQTSVVEIGSNHAGEISVLTRAALPTHALITNIGGAHLEFFANNEAIAREKKDLFLEMEDAGTIFLNLDDPFLTDFRDDKKTIITYSLLQKAQVRGRDKGMNEQGCGSFTLNDKVEIQLQVAGAHNIKNALAASAAALHFGFTEVEIREALEDFRAADKRMQTLNHKGAIIINDAYNANPLSMKAAFDTIKKMRSGKKLFIVLGDMFELGEQSMHLHRIALEQALELSPQNIFIMGGAMRTAMRAAKETLKQPEQERIVCFENHRDLAVVLDEELEAGDLVLIKGSRGMQMEKVLEYMRT